MVICSCDFPPLVGNRNLRGCLACTTRLLRDVVLLVRLFEAMTGLILLSSRYCAENYWLCIAISSRSSTCTARRVAASGCHAFSLNDRFVAKQRERLLCMGDEDS